jgi:hypothetical protein
MAAGQKKRLAEMNSVHTIQVNIKEYNTAFTLPDMLFILENFDTGSQFQTEPFELSLGKEPDAPVAIGQIGFYPHGAQRRSYGHLNAFFLLCSSPYELEFHFEAAILDEQVRFFLTKHKYTTSIFFICKKVIADGFVLPCFTSLHLSGK